jgi:hypothetical protein
MKIRYSSDKKQIVEYRITAQLVASNLKQGSDLLLNDSENV